MQYKFSRVDYNDLLGIQMPINERKGFCIYKSTTDVYIMIVRIQNKTVFIGSTIFPLAPVNEVSHFVKHLGRRGDRSRDTDYEFVYFEQSEIDEMFSSQNAGNQVYFEETPMYFRVSDNQNQGTIRRQYESMTCSPRATVDALDDAFSARRTDEEGIEYSIGKPCPPVWGYERFFVLINQLSSIAPTIWIPSKKWLQLDTAKEKILHDKVLSLKERLKI